MPRPSPRRSRSPFRLLVPLPILAPVVAPLLAWAGAATPARAADLPFFPVPPPIYGAQSYGAQGYGDAVLGGGGFRVARVPVRPAPQRFDIYGYPLLAGVPSPLAVGNGCPAAVQPDYDPDGNFAGYAPVPMCR